MGQQRALPPSVLPQRGNVQALPLWFASFPGGERRKTKGQRTSCPFGIPPEGVKLFATTTSLLFPFGSLRDDNGGQSCIPSGLFPPEGENKGRIVAPKGQNGGDKDKAKPEGVNYGDATIALWALVARLLPHRGKEANRREDKLLPGGQRQRSSKGAT